MRSAGIAVTVVPTGDRHSSEYLSEHDKVRRWLSGFTGSAGTLVVSADGAALFTDGRYFLQAERELSGSGIRLMRMGTPGVPAPYAYAAELAAGGTGGVDASAVSAETFGAFEDALKERGGRLLDIGGWADELWTDRPPLPGAEAYPLPETLTGRSAADKLSAIRAAMAEAGAGAHVTNVLDDIAWTLNVRGGDVAYTPVVMSFLLVTEDGAVWFVDERKVTEETRAALRAAGVRTAPYEDVNRALRALPEGTRVLADPKRLSADLAACLKGRLIPGENPAFRMKAVKNETELVCFRDAHVRDGAALTRFMFWLKRNYGRVPMRETDAAEKLRALRMEDPACRSLSFETICAWRENAAMMHYGAEPGKDAEISGDGLLLVDSGGQYPGATTDVTRTFALGEIPEEQKIHYTAVLEAVMRLSSARFLYGMSGMTLDVLARAPIWALGLDYRCGTGHGVGAMLSVHEGPNGFRWYRSEGRGEDTRLEPGMVTTDEPGIYVEGSHGIRTENELVCRAVGENEYGRYLGFETLTCAPVDLDPLLPDRLSREARDALNAYHADVREKLLPLLKTGEEREFLRHATRAV